MEHGNKMRTAAMTTMNATSSRSHVVVTIHFEQIFLDEAITKQPVINLADLSGSERQKSSGSEGDRLKEGRRVNLSLTTLGNVTSALAEVATGKRVEHIPYRDLVLTKLLQSAPGGNSRTIMRLRPLSPADICYEETLSTLPYAERTKRVRNKAVVNASPSEKLLREPQAENNKLSSRLAGLGSTGRPIADGTRVWFLLAENKRRIWSTQATWESRLEEAQKEWEHQHAAVAQ
ncbi:KIF28 protein, partial [Circaetus pectoralis]|nr:KIF28 protein [Circaetus pectoralis]